MILARVEAVKNTKTAVEKTNSRQIDKDIWNMRRGESEWLN